MNKAKSARGVRRIVEAVGSQERAGRILGLDQGNVSRIVNDPDSKQDGPTRALVGRVALEAHVRYLWLDAWAVFWLESRKAAGLVATFERIDSVGRRRSQGSIKIDIPPVAGGARTAVIEGVIRDLVADYLDAGFLPSGGYFSFYREDGDDILVTTYEANDGTIKGSSIPGFDPINGR